ncbi:MAG: protoglobin domain-containing protein [Planctomycetota bacterium]|jgi:signal transduction histidine kinase
MQKFGFEELKAYIGFTDQDAMNLRALAGPATPLIPRVRDRFYEVMLNHPAAMGVFRGKEQVFRLKQVFNEWLRTLFNGVYDERYFESRERIGHTHVRVGLPQRYMPLAMEVVRCELMGGLRRLDIEAREEKLESLSKLLTLDLTIMLGSYQESYANHIREFERKAMEAKLARARHLAEIGQLAASLAHEIKNPLAGISGAIQIIGESLEADSPYRSIVRDIQGQISRLDATVKDLLLYARPTAPERTEIKLGELVTRLIGLLHQEPALRNVELHFRNDDAIAFADERQLEQLLMNLILNAAHASADGTAIEIKVVEKDDSVTLEVSDRGDGMPEEVRKKALEPFFTTKAKGTGLGLAICRRIAESHGGAIVIDSQPGQGTTVAVKLPRELQRSEAEKN